MSSPFRPSIRTTPPGVLGPREYSTPSSRSYTQGSFTTQHMPTREQGNDSFTGTAASSLYNTLPLTQPRPQALTSPSITQRDGMDFQDINSNFARPIINAAFIEAVAQSMGFQATDEVYRSSLHSIPMMAPDMMKGPMQLSIFHTGLMYAILKECRTMSESLQAMQAILSNMQTRFEDSFMLTKEQKTNIRLVAGELLLEPNRVCYTQISVDVEIKIRENQKDLQFFNIFGNLARQRHLGTIIRRTCSSLRNAYREMLRDSVIGPNTSTLDDFVISLSNRFTSRVSLGQTSIAHVALLRRFAVEHPHILDRVAEDEDAANDDDEQAEGRSRSPSTRPDSPADYEYGTQPCTPLSVRSRKRKRPISHIFGPQQKGSDFWSMVDKWFTARMQPDQLGASWKTPGWKVYIEETIELDRAKFKPVTIVNPFLTDFLTTGDNGDDDDGATQQVNTIGSMHGILGAL